MNLPKDLERALKHPKFTPEERSLFVERLAQNNPNWLGRVREMRPGLSLFTGTTASGKTTALAVSAETLKAERPGTTFLFLGDQDQYSFMDDEPNSSHADVIIVDELRDSSICLRVFRWLQEGRTVWATIHASTHEQGKQRFAALLKQSFDMSQPAMADFARHVESELTNMMASDNVATILAVRKSMTAAA